MLTGDSFLALIVYKIWSIERRGRAAFGGTSVSDNSTLRRAMRIIIESGLMYSVGVTVFFVVYLASNNAQYGVSDCVSSTYGLVTVVYNTDLLAFSPRLSRSLYVVLFRHIGLVMPDKNHIPVAASRESPSISSSSALTKAKRSNPPSSQNVAAPAHRCINVLCGPVFPGALGPAPQ